MTYDEFKQNFLPEFLNINSYAGRMRYTNENLQRIGSGTGRAVFDIDGEKVLKLAKNAKGVAQNGAEAGAGYYRDTQHIVTKIFDSADDDTWLIAEYAKKVNEKRIKELTGIPSLNDLFYFLRNTIEENKGGKKIFRQDNKMVDFFWENEFSSNLIDFAINYGQIVGDMGRPSSYGEVLRDGQPAIVLTDYGLNDEVYDTHYNPQRKKRYQMYELFNYADGNDDILSDAGGGQDIRTGMWAQMPYSVDDGGDNSDAVINESFINLVSNRDKYPDKSVEGLPVLTDHFHDCVNNIKETLKLVDNKKQFYGNLLKLQEYLIRRGFWNRDPLISEEYIINEEIPAVEYNTLTNRKYSDELAKQVANKLNLTQPKYLGGGGNGFAYKINDNLVMKLTTDISEADAASKLVRRKPQNIATIFNLYKVLDTETNKTFFVIMQENINDKPLEKFRKLQNDITKISPNGLKYEDIMVSIKKPKNFNHTKMLEFAKQLLIENPEAGVSRIEREAAYQYLVDMFNIRNELLEYGIKSVDYITIANLGYKDNTLKFFDVGDYYGVGEPDVGNNIIQLPETITEEQLEEDYPREKADKIAIRIANKLGIQEPKYLGHGTIGVAYDIGDNKVLKITKDNSEAYENLKLVGKQLKYIADTYRVFEVTPENIPESEKKTYAIILEKLVPDKANFKRMYDRLDYVFKNIFDTDYKEALDSYLDGYQYNDDAIDKSKIDNYFKKNSQDGKFFFSILRIAKELRELGINSYDFYNPENLGYKKNGVIAFFDVGFSDGFAQPRGAEKISVEVDEDGSSKFSTDKAMGQDEFPPYNTNDTSPSINNDLDANIAMYEDLEYNHVVGDATEDEYKLEENNEYKEYETEKEGLENRINDLYSRVDKLMADTDLEFLKPYLSSEEMDLVYKNKLTSHQYFNTGKNPYSGAHKIMQRAWKELKESDPENYEEYRKISEKNFQKFKAVQEFNKTHRFALEKKYGGVERYGMGGDIDTNDLSHFTKTEHAISILKDGYFMTGDEGGIAFTTNKNLIKQRKPVFYHPQSWGYEGTTHRNLSTQFVLDFNKIKQDGIRFKQGNEDIGSHGGEEEIRLYPKDNNLQLQPYLKNVIFDPTKEKDDNLSNELLKFLKEKNIQHYVKNDEVSESELTERNKSFATGSKTVKVKRKCQLAGLGNTSVACNQGDINNLEFGSVNEEDLEVKEYFSNLVPQIDEGNIDMTELNRGVFKDEPQYVPNFPIKNLTVSKRGIFGAIQDIKQSKPSKTSEPALVFYNISNKTFLVEDGYHRVAQAFLDKQKTIPVNIYSDMWSDYVANISPENKFNLDEGEIMKLQDLPFKEEVEQLGGKIYSVGGAVRDEFLGKESKDLDVLISGVPMDSLEQLLSKYGGVNAVGKSFGVLKFVPKGAKEEIDIAIPRTEVTTGDGGHKGFDVTSDHELPIEKDLERRDFTINAIAKDIDGNLIDPYNGQEDLKNKIIRIVNPEAFSDDPLRMLRAIGFASRFGFTIEPKTMQMIVDNAVKITEIAPERILIELDKIVKKGDSRIGVNLLASTGLFKQIFGNEIQLSQIGNRNFENVKTMAELLFLMMNGVVQNPAEFYLNRFSTEDAKRDKIYKELQALDLAFNSDLLDQQMNSVKARSIAHNMFTIAPQTLESQILPKIVKNAVQELLQGKYPKTVNELAVNGNDLMQKGLQGKAISDMQKSLLIRIYSDKIRNDREELLSLVSEKDKEVQEGYFKYSEMQPKTWDINGKQVTIDFFVQEYDKWNNQNTTPGYSDPSHESVLEFFQNNYEDFSNNEKLKKELYWVLTDRDILNENMNKKEKIKYGALMLFLDVSVWKKITSIIKKDDIYEKDGEFGIETEPHVTILYGFHTEVTADDVFNLYKENFELKPIEISVEGISIFENEEFDVVKMDVNSKTLGKMNSVMRELPNTTRFPKYHAHITVAYVKKGCGKNYIKSFEKNRILVGNELVFSTEKEKQIRLKLSVKGLLKEEMKKISYSAVVLDDKSKASLLKVLSPMIPEGWEVVADHMTIKMGALENGSEAQEDMENNIEISLKVIDYAMDDLVMAVGVEGYHSDKPKPHITIAVNRADGGKPHFSNKLIDWKPLGFPLNLTGKVNEE